MVVGDLNARITEWHLMTDADIGDFGVGGVSADENEKKAGGRTNVQTSLGIYCLIFVPRFRVFH